MKENSRDRVFTTVLELLRDSSLYELNISQLKKETGLATGTFYYHFPNGIEDVLSALFRLIVSELREELLELAAEDAPLDITFKKVISRYFSWHATEIDKSNFLVSVSASGFKDFREVMRDEFSFFSTRMYELIQSKAQEQNYTLVGPTIMDAFLLGATRELIHSWIVRGRDEDELENLKDKYIDILFHTCIESNR